jgi:hypothetical protein
MIHDFRLISGKSDKTLLFGVGLLKTAQLLPVAEDFFQKKGPLILSQQSFFIFLQHVKRSARPNDHAFNKYFLRINNENYLFSQCLTSFFSQLSIRPFPEVSFSPSPNVRVKSSASCDDSQPSGNIPGSKALTILNLA